MDSKENITRYIIKLLLEWQKEVDPKRTENDLSKLKVLGLMFLLSTVSYKGLDLSKLGFLNYMVVPLGCFEKDVYELILADDNVGYGKVENVNFEVPSLSLTTELLLDVLLRELKNKHMDLISKPPFYIVDLIREWDFHIITRKENTENRVEIPLEKIQKSSRRYYTF